METSGAGALGIVVLWCALASAGCERRVNTPPSPSTSAGTTTGGGTSAPGSSTPLAGIVPQSENVPASGAADTAAGPAAGQTSVGGVVGHQDSGGARKGGLRPRPAVTVVPHRVPVETGGRVGVIGARRGF